MIRSDTRKNGLVGVFMILWCPRIVVERVVTHRKIVIVVPAAPELEVTGEIVVWLNPCILPYPPECAFDG